MDPFTISLARGGLVIRPNDSRGGFKGEASWLAENIGGRWVHVVHGYRVTEKQAANMRKLWYAGWRGCFRLMERQPAMVEKGGVKMTPRQALKLC